MNFNFGRQGNIDNTEYYNILNVDSQHQSMPFTVYLVRCA